MCRIGFTAAQRCSMTPEHAGLTDIFTGIWWSMRLHHRRIFTGNAIMIHSTRHRGRGMCPSGSAHAPGAGCQHAVGQQLSAQQAGLTGSAAVRRALCPLQPPCLRVRGAAAFASSAEAASPWPRLLWLATPQFCLVWQRWGCCKRQYAQPRLQLPEQLLGKLLGQHCRLRLAWQARLSGQLQETSIVPQDLAW